MNGQTTTTQTTEKPVGEVAVPAVERTTTEHTESSHTEVVPQVPESQPDGSTVAKDAPTEGGTRFR